MDYEQICFQWNKLLSVSKIMSFMMKFMVPGIFLVLLLFSIFCFVLLILTCHLGFIIICIVLQCCGALDQLPSSPYIISGFVLFLFLFF